tara:strand:+ start:512 stop:904 length:393 start_codon:yes stop_codon:yes gene_type:complete
MNKVVAVIFCLIASFSVSALEWPHENISTAEFALEVKERTPLNIIEELDNSFGKIYFFTNIRNLQGQSIRHRWIYKNKVMAEVEFDINGPRWRVWSSKNLWPTWLGEWSVEVLNANSEVLYKKEFNYIEK